MLTLPDEDQLGLYLNIETAQITQSLATSTGIAFVMNGGNMGAGFYKHLYDNDETAETAATRAAYRSRQKQREAPYKTGGVDE